ncbi:MAG: sporulation protein YunB [Clostridia bacterium]|nr:sporulation protein YunB [Clostridia bacterium]
MNRYKRKRLWKTKYIIFILIFISLFVIILLQMRPFAESFLQNAAANAAIVRINDTVNNYLGATQTDYDDITFFQTDESGQITAICIRTEWLNKIKTGVASEAAKQFEQLQSVDLQLPIGSLFGNGLLAGKGLLIPITVAYTATVQADLKNLFITRGINQTQHRIILQIDAIVKTLSFGKTQEIPVSTQITVAETVIIGRIPEIYAGADDELWPNLVEK